MNVKLLTKHDFDCLTLTGGYTGSSESNHVKMPHCWKSHVTAQMSKFEYRSFRDFNQDQFTMNLQAVDFSYVHSAGTDGNTVYDKFEH